MSGDYPSKKEVANLLVPSVGRKVLDLAGDLEKGQFYPVFLRILSDSQPGLSTALTYKLMANSMVLGTMEILAEALTFAEKSGIGSERVLDLVKGWFISHCLRKVRALMVAHTDFFPAPRYVYLF